MANVIDVADYIKTILPETNEETLQNLCYLCQGWFMVWNSRPLFSEDFEAHKIGPICSELKNREAKGNPLEPSEAQLVERVLASYGSFSPTRLSILTTSGKPYRSARRSSGGIISKETQQKYFKGICYGLPC